MLSGPANAYLDPGIIAASIATLSFYWNKVKLFLVKLFKKDKKSESN